MMTPKQEVFPELYSAFTGNRDVTFYSYIDFSFNYGYNTALMLFAGSKSRRKVTGEAADKTISYNSVTGMVIKGFNEYTWEQYRNKFCNLVSITFLNYNRGPFNYIFEISYNFNWKRPWSDLRLLFFHIQIVLLEKLNWRKQNTGLIL